MKKIWYLVIFLLSHAILISQAPNIEWAKCYGGSNWDEIANSIIELKGEDGGYVIAGTTYSHDGDIKGNHGAHDIWIVKLNQLGEIIWQKCLGGSCEDIANSIIETHDGDIIVAGSTFSYDGDIKGSHGYYDYWIVKLNQSGELLWQKCLGGSGYDEANTTIETDDEGFVLAGCSNSSDGDVTGSHSESCGKAWIVKLNQTGVLLWQKVLGGFSGDEANTIKETKEGGYIFAGTTWSYNGDVIGNHGMGDAWIVKLDNKGELLWQKCLGCSKEDVANSIIETNDGGYIITGTTYSNDCDVTGNHGTVDIWVVKLSPETAVNDFEDRNYSLSISPNPASSNITISFPNTEVSDITITNSLGMEIKHFSPAELEGQSAISYSTEDLTPGVYYCTLSSGHERISKKFVVVR